MPTPTYIALQTITLNSSASEVVFSGIPSSYRDLILVSQVSIGGNDIGARIRFNRDTAGNYAWVTMTGFNPTNTGSGSNTDSNILVMGWQVGATSSGEKSTFICQIMDYSATDKYKTVITKFRSKSSTGDEVGAIAGRWTGTNAIDTITVYPPSTTFSSGSTLSLYGIEG